MPQSSHWHLQLYSLLARVDRFRQGLPCHGTGIATYTRCAVISCMPPGGVKMMKGGRGCLQGRGGVLVSAKSLLQKLQWRWRRLNVKRWRHSGAQFQPSPTLRDGLGVSGRLVFEVKHFKRCEWLEAYWERNPNWRNRPPPPPLRSTLSSEGGWVTTNAYQALLCTDVAWISATYPERN